MTAHMEAKGPESVGAPDRGLRGLEPKLTLLSVCGFLLVVAFMGAAAAILFADSPHPISTQLDALNEVAIPP